MATSPKIHGQTGQKRKRQDNRASASERGYDGKWKKLRESYVKRFPICEECEKTGIVSEVDEVDHIIPFDPNNPSDPLRLDWNNLRSLCKRHHGEKTWRDRRKYNAE